MHYSDSGSQREGSAEGEVSEAGGGWAELEVSRSPKAIVAHDDPAEQHTFSLSATGI